MTFTAFLKFSYALLPGQLIFRRNYLPNTKAQSSSNLVLTGTTCNVLKEFNFFTERHVCLNGCQVRMARRVYRKRYPCGCCGRWSQHESSRPEIKLRKFFHSCIVAKSHIPKYLPALIHNCKESS